MLTRVSIPLNPIWGNHSERGDAHSARMDPHFFEGRLWGFAAKSLSARGGGFCIPSCFLVSFLCLGFYVWHFPPSVYHDKWDTAKYLIMFLFKTIKTAKNLKSLMLMTEFFTYIIFEIKQDCRALKLNLICF